MPSHAVRILVHAAVANRKAAGILYVDLVSAFYTVVRQLCLEIPTDDMSVAQLMQPVELPQTAPHKAAQGAHSCQGSRSWTTLVELDDVDR